MLPDLDVVAFQLHIPYSHWLGHRGFSHSLFFAIVVVAIVARMEFAQLRPYGARWRGGVALFTVALALHGLFDALTDGDRGVAFFLPFDRSRYFLPI